MSSRRDHPVASSPPTTCLNILIAASQGRLASFRRSSTRTALFPPAAPPHTLERARHCLAARSRLVDASVSQTQENRSSSIPLRSLDECLRRSVFVASSPAHLRALGKTARRGKSESKWPEPKWKGENAFVLPIRCSRVGSYWPAQGYQSRLRCALRQTTACHKIQTPIRCQRLFSTLGGREFLCCALEFAQREIKTQLRYQLRETERLFLFIWSGIRPLFATKASKTR